MNELCYYLNDPDFWFACVVVLVFQKILSVIFDSIISYIKELGVEEYKNKK